MPSKLMRITTERPNDRRLQREKPMPAQMTATAWRQGFKNASVVLIAVMAIWAVLFAIVIRVTGLSLRDSAGVAFAVFAGATLILFLATWLRSRSQAGPVLLDCGPHPSRALFYVNAVLFPIMGTMIGLAQFGHWPAAAIAAPLLGLGFSAYWIIMARGRLQVRENGLWQYWGLLRWNRIASYRWADDSTLLIRSTGPLSMLQGALPVPPEYQERVNELLERHCTEKVISSES
jgi:hypothetical protein